MRAFCQRQGVAMESVRFLFDGNRIRENQTPNEQEMEDGDSIEVFVALTGGPPPEPFVMADEESKQGEEAKPNTMQLKVVSQDGTEGVLLPLSGVLPR